MYCIVYAVGQSGNNPDVTTLRVPNVTKARPGLKTIIIAETLGLTLLSSKAKTERNIAISLKTERNGE